MARARGYDDVCQDIFIVRSKINSRGRPLKLHKKVLDWALQNILSVVNEWNFLS